MKKYLIAFVLLGMVADAKILDGQDWPRFRGSDGDGRSEETGLMSEWPKEGPKLLWTATDLGRGYSSVSIVGDQLFTIGDLDDGQYVFSVSTKDGKPIWKTRLGDSNRGSYLGSRSTPAVDSGRVYVLSTDAQLFCFDAKDGKTIWKKDLVESYGAKMMLAKGKWEWRFAESPIVDGDQVVVTPGAKVAAMVAFDKTNGQEKWKCELPDSLGEKGVDGAGYSTIVIGNACGVRQYVQLIGRGVIAVDAKTGKFLWNYNRVANDIANISSPVVSGDHVFASTGYQTGSALLKLVKNDRGQFEVEEKYFLDPKTFQNHHGGFILHDGYIFGGQGHKMGLPICIRMKDGKVMWGPKRNLGKSSAAVCYADGRLYFRYQNGLMMLIDANPEKYVEKSSFMIPDVRAESWSHPVISNGRLYLKEQERILCYDVAGT